MVGWLRHGVAKVLLWLWEDLMLQALVRLGVSLLMVLIATGIGLIAGSVGLAVARQLVLTGF